MFYTDWDEIKTHNVVYNCDNGDLNGPGSFCASIEQTFVIVLPGSYLVESTQDTEQ